MSILYILISSCTSSTNKETDEPIYLGQSNIYISNGWYKGLMEALDDNPDDPQNHLRLSQYFEAKNNLAKSLEFSLSGLLLDDKNCELLIQAAGIYQKLNQYKDGYELAEKGQQAGCRSIKLNLLLAEFLIKDGKYAAAQFYLNELLKNVPNQTETYYLKGLVALGEGDTIKATTNLEKYASSNGSKQIAYELLSSILLKRGKLEQAVEFAHKGLQIAPSNNLYLTVSKLYFKLNQSDTAWALLNNAIKDSTFVEALGYAGEAYFKRKNYKEAIQCFTKESRLSPLPKHNLWIAEAFVKTGDFDSAKLYYQQILDSDTSNILIERELMKLNKNVFKQEMVKRKSRYLPDSTSLGAPTNLDTIQEP